MLVCYLTDEPGKIPAIRAALEPRYPVVPRVLGQEPIFAPSGVLMVDADLREGDRVAQIKHVMRDLDAISESCSSFTTRCITWWPRLMRSARPGWFTAPSRRL